MRAVLVAAILLAACAGAPEDNATLGPGHVVDGSGDAGEAVGEGQAGSGDGMVADEANGTSTVGQGDPSEDAGANEDVEAPVAGTGDGSGDGDTQGDGSAGDPGADEGGDGGDEGGEDAGGADPLEPLPDPIPSDPLDPIIGGSLLG